ncbi:hypothetical protein [Silanimonas sp.]|uniref:hypothetical protein n=1 Tax=Silanimonas sp. TaxID=1929290 RepID=UPI0022BDA73D|nr:hypothetical protein [Silanimonas sp.]MCZ8062586.1 hypothetical protein [Silanimonas sp.]
MKKTPLALALLLSSPWALAQNAADAAALPLGMGAGVRGEITTANRINYSDGSRSIVYAIDLDAGQAVSFEASGALCARLFVMRDGEAVAGPTQSQCGEAPEGVRLTMMASEKGRYEVAVSGSGPRAFGPFRLDAKPLQVHRGEGPLRPGADIADLVGRDGKSYRLEIRQAGYYQIEMRSSEFDSALELQGNGVSISDDDGGGGLNARLSAPLEAGTYNPAREIGGRGDRPVPAGRGHGRAAGWRASAQQRRAGPRRQRRARRPDRQPARVPAAGEAAGARHHRTRQ